MPGINIDLLVYGIAMLVMGIHGFINGSVVSLIAAGSVGVIIIGTVALHKTNPRPARIIGAVVSLLTLLNEGKSYMFPKPPTDAPVTRAPIERKIYPHGVAAGLSLIGFVVLGSGHILAKRASASSDQKS